MNRSHVQRSQKEDQQRKSARGFSLIELAFVVMITLIMTAMAIPLVNNVTSYFRLRGAISSITGAVQSTRYQAIFQGCPYQLVFTAAANTYQIQNQCPAPGAPIGAPVGPFANVCTPPVVNCPVPLSGSGIPVTLNADITLTFSPGGRVTSATAPMSMVVTYGGKPPETITVSTYGNINVTP